MQSTTVLRARAPVAALAAALLAATLAGGGCVERKMLIRSDPPGAAIALDGQDTELRTPAEIPFDYGGTRAVTLTAPGHRVLEATAKLEDPWFTYFPLDFVAEFLWFGTIHDDQKFDYRLDAYGQLTPDLKSEAKKRLSELKLRAEEYRAGGSEGPGKAPAPAAPAAPPAPSPAPPAPEAAPKK